VPQEKGKKNGKKKVFCFFFFFFASKSRSCGASPCFHVHACKCAHCVCQARRCRPHVHLGAHARGPRGVEQKKKELETMTFATGEFADL
jgi:hypothetical protein